MSASSVLEMILEERENRIDKLGAERWRLHIKVKKNNWLENGAVLKRTCRDRSLHATQHHGVWTMCCMAFRETERREEERNSEHKR